MKKVRLTGKLSLSKETISKLNNGQMGHVHGGGKNPDSALCTIVPTTATVSGSNATNSPVISGTHPLGDCCL
jgi:hypothetical protein